MKPLLLLVRQEGAEGRSCSTETPAPLEGSTGQQTRGLVTTCSQRENTGHLLLHRPPPLLGAADPACVSLTGRALPVHSCSSREWRCPCPAAR